MIAGRRITLILNTALILLVLLSSCQRTTAGVPSSTPWPTAASHTPSPGASPTVRPTQTPSPTMEPSPEPSPSLTPTPTSTPLNLANTPIPGVLSPITGDNLHQVQTLAVWGQGAANVLALSSDSSLFAVGTDIGTYLYDSFDFRFVALLRSIHPVRAVAFSPDDQLIAVVEGTQRVVLYDQAALTPSKTLLLAGQLPQGKSLPSLLFTATSNQLVLISEAEEMLTILRWEGEDWNETAVHTVESGLSYFVNPAVNLLGVIGEQGLTLHSLTLLGDSRTLPLPPDPGEVILAAQSSAPEPIVPAASGDFLLINQAITVAYWDLLREEVTETYGRYPLREPDPCEGIPETCRRAGGGYAFPCPEAPARTAILHMAISPDDQKLLVSLDSGRTQLRSILTGEVLWEIDESYTRFFFSLNDRFLLGLRPDGTIDKRDLFSGELVLVLKQHPSRLLSLDFSPDGSLLAAGFSDGWIRMFSGTSGEMLGVLDGIAHSLRFSPAGGELAAGLENGQVRIFDLDRSRFFDLDTRQAAPVTGLAFSGEGERLTSAGLDCAVSRWNLTDRYRTNLLIPGGDQPFPILGLEASLHGEQLIAGGEQILQLLVDHETPARVPVPPDASLSAFALSHDGRQVAMGGNAVWLALVDASGFPGEAQQVTPFSFEDPFQVAFLPGTNLLVAPNSQVLSFYANGASTGSVLVQQIPLPPSIGRIAQLRLTSRSDMIAIGGENGLIHILGIPKE